MHKQAPIARRLTEDGPVGCSGLDMVAAEDCAQTHLDR
jgi:hypothetical protein